jgi:hypothetical protein
VFVDVLEALCVHARRAAISATSPVRFGKNVLSAHLIPQAVETRGWFCLGFRLQCGLQRPNRFKRGS